MLSMEGGCMCHVRIHGKKCHRKGCGEEVPILDFVVMKGDDGQLHSYHEYCYQVVLMERERRQTQLEHYEIPILVGA